MTTLSNEGVRVEAADRCLLCGIPGETLYSNLRDRVFDAPGVWNIRRCPTCGLLWLDPRPIAADLGALYDRYYTHADAQPRLAGVRRAIRNGVLANAFGYNELRDGPSRTLLGRFLTALPPVRDRVGAGIDYLDGRLRGRMLDVGCGSGMFLWRMKQLGWEVEGVDPDPRAVENARDKYDIPVALGDLATASFAAESFDAITLNHVIEHAVDPIALLSACARVLKPRGRVVMITPNIDSLGHASQRAAWRGLEPPRHLYLFSRSTLSVCVDRAGLRVDDARTSARASASIWTAGWEAATTGRSSSAIDASLRFHPRSLWFQLREELAVVRGRPVGEELVIIATRRSR